MNTNDLWPTALEALEALGAHYLPTMYQAAAKFGLYDVFGWLLPALWLEPEPVSANRLRQRSPYTSAGLFADRLAKAAGSGFLAATAEGENEYYLTELGRQAAEEVMRALYAKMASLQPIATADMERLAGLLRRLVEASLAAPEMPEKRHLLHSRRIDPGPNASVVARIDQYGSDLAAYRDDAHQAAWGPLAIEGHAWEAFTLLWRGEARTLDELCQKLARRGYSPEEYGRALEDLLRRGWIKEEAGNYLVTDQGREMRQAAEEATDRYFYTPWSCLSQGEIEELENLLILFCDGLRFWLD